MEKQELEKLIEENEYLIRKNELEKTTDPSQERHAFNLYNRREELLKLYSKKTDGKQDDYQTLTLRIADQKVTSVKAKRNYDVDLKYCFRCGGITNVERAFPDLDEGHQETFGCGCP